ncbi:hypothetical protein AAVH_24125 [Aphelenchoides avenae]|nr:hypothetical protein AAVH_24125 [Aphelenchus avenae]
MASSTAQTIVYDGTVVYDEVMATEGGVDAGFLRRLTTTRMVFEGLGCALSVLVLALSFKRHKASFNLGPRIFTANLMIFNLIHSLCSLLLDWTFLDFRVLFKLGRFGVVITSITRNIQTVPFLVFNGAFSPLMVMSIWAAQGTRMLTQRQNAFYMCALVAVADLVPVVYQSVQVATNSSRSSVVQLPYALISYVLYIAQIGVTVASLRIIRAKNANMSVSDGGC